MFLFSGSFNVKCCTIRGVQYNVFSFYSEENNVFGHLENLIKNSFESSSVDEITNDDSVDNDIANKAG